MTTPHQKHLEQLLREMLQNPPCTKTLSRGLHLAYSETENLNRLTLSRKSHQIDTPIYPSPAEVKIVADILANITNITPITSAQKLKASKKEKAIWGYQTLSWTKPAGQQTPLITTPNPTNYKD